MPKNEVRNIGLFVDFENIVRGIEGGKTRGPDDGGFDIRLVLDRLLEKGNVVVKKAYCDWTRFKTYKEPLHDAAFELIEIPKKRNNSKNSADICMVVDIMDMAFTKAHIDTFCLLTGDSDFSPLVSKLRENNRNVIGCGVKMTVSAHLADNCDEFLYYEDLVKDRALRAKRQKKVKLAHPEDEEAFSYVTDAIDALALDGHEKIWGSMVKQMIKRKFPQFSEASYDFATFSELLEEVARAGLVSLERDPKSGGYLVDRNA